MYGCFLRRSSVGLRFLGWLPQHSRKFVRMLANQGESTRSVEVRTTETGYPISYSNIIHGAQGHTYYKKGGVREHCSMHSRNPRDHHGAGLALTPT